MKECPQCGEMTFVVSIFGSICDSCLYDPEQDTLEEFKEGVDDE